MFEPSIEELILSGAVEVAGIDSVTGEFLYNFTDRLKDVLPELYSERLAFINEEVMDFLDRGFLAIEDSEDVKNPLIFLTELAFDEDAISELSKEKQQSLREIKRMFEK
jgi:hypothetical protein